MFSNSSTNSSKTAIDLLHKSAFKNKFAETSCESLGIPCEIIKRAYQEVEGLVGFFYTKNLAFTTTEANNNNNNLSSDHDHYQKLFQKYTSLIFTDENNEEGKNRLSSSEETKRRQDYIEHISQTWPNNWFRNVGERKCQLQIPLSYLMTSKDDYKFDNFSNYCSAQTHQNNKQNNKAILPPALHSLSIALETIVTNYLESLLVTKNLIPSAFEKGLFVVNSSSSNTNEQAARSHLLEKMKKKSVLRLWIYFGDDDEEKSSPEAENNKKTDEKSDDVSSNNEDVINNHKNEENIPCRGHFDPGIVTVLLSGSRSGLQVHKTFTGAGGGNAAAHPNDQSPSTSSSSSYEYATHDVHNQAKEEDWINIGYHQNQNQQEKEKIIFSDSNIVLMNDTMLQVLTAGVAEHAFHRVIEREDGNMANNNNNNNNNSRIQIVLELRPDNAGKWYGFVPTEEEKRRLLSERDHQRVE